MATLLRATPGEFGMVINRGTVFGPPAGVLEQRPLECAIPFWPHGFGTVYCDMDELLQHGHSEYACLGCGPTRSDALARFCRMTGIKAIPPQGL
jgi:hypothetical protein